MMLRGFALDQPTTVAEACDLLGRYGETAKAYAGGTELLLVMKQDLGRYTHLVDLKKIDGLDAVTDESGALRMGALATHRALEDSRVLRAHFPEVAAMEARVANVRVRNVGTLGGNLCFAEPHSDPGTLLLTLDAELRIGRRDGERRMALDGFFRGPYETALEPDELLLEVVIPRSRNRSRACYEKFGYLERPSVGVAARLTLSDDGEGVGACRIAVGSAGPMPVRVPSAEALLEGRDLDEVLRRADEAGRRAAAEADAISDLHGSADYKRHLVRVLLVRCLARAVEGLRDGRH